VRRYHLLLFVLRWKETFLGGDFGVGMIVIRVPAGGAKRTEFFVMVLRRTS